MTATSVRALATQQINRWETNMAPFFINGSQGTLPSDSLWKEEERDGEREMDRERKQRWSSCAAINVPI